MTPLEEQLRTELEEEAGGIELPPGYVTTSVEVVRVRRRRRQVTAMAAVVVTILAVGGVALGANVNDDAKAPTADRPTPPAPDQSPPALALQDMQRPPTARVLASLAWRDTALPRVMPSGVATAPGLSKDPIDHAVALVAGRGTEVGVVGDDGRLRRLDGVTLEQLRDPPYFQTGPIQPGSLTPDGTQAAFPQPDAVVVVDLTSGVSKRLDLPGSNTEVVWHPDQRHVLVGRELGGTRLLDTVDGSVDDAPYDAYRSTFTPNGSAVQVEETPNADSPSQLTLGDLDSAEAQRSLPIWYDAVTPPTATDQYVMVTGSVHTVRGNLGRYEDGWIVIDLESGEPVAMLRAGTALRAGVLDAGHGWLDDQTVLIEGSNHLIAWTPDTGVLERVTEANRGGLSLATDVLE